MKPIEWYEEKFHRGGPSRGIVYYPNRVEIDYWVYIYILRRCGIKSKKKRIINKILKEKISYLMDKKVENRKILIGISCPVFYVPCFFEERPLRNLIQLINVLN